jgi:hypothetical protein
VGSGAGERSPAPSSYISKDTAYDRKLRRLMHTCNEACIVMSDYEEHVYPVRSNGTVIAYVEIKPPSLWERIVDFFKREDVGW